MNRRGFLRGLLAAPLAPMLPSASALIGPAPVVILEEVAQAAPAVQIAAGNLVRDGAFCLPGGFGKSVFVQRMVPGAVALNLALCDATDLMGLPTVEEA